MNPVPSTLSIYMKKCITPSITLDLPLTLKDAYTITAVTGEAAF
ncbi:hypothetical protein BN8_p06767 (plasmid) [Fibrisoma limi BUZ 3]|uniref:Uncharacterized protein n=1 Tax=Fibrisoma limi BUZ 3 TaxID=1185876 RepID=I2GTX7_9BACT|nr:hypothetical protein BN8_p06767 [Fibrisoma limi BUZ 3]